MNGNENELVEEEVTPPAQLEIYREALLWLFKFTLFVILIITGALWIMDSWGVDILKILVLVVLAGALGALFSALTRLYSLRQLPKALMSLDKPELKNRYLLVFCLVPPVIGMIGAAFFYVFMQSEILTSSLFVNFSCKANEENVCEGVRCLLLYSPCLPSDYAKAIVWGFVSGFSERLVPDALARLENASKDK